MQIAVDSHTKAHEAFEDIIGHYQERLGATSLSPMTLSTTYDFGAPQVTRSSSAPTSSDFVADVELAARASLEADEYPIFIHIYRNQLKPPSLEYIAHNLTNPRVQSILIDIRMKVGKELVRRGMSSLVEYLTPTPRAVRVGQ